MSHSKGMLGVRRRYTAESWQQALAGLDRSQGSIELPSASAEQAWFEAKVLLAIGYGMEPRNLVTGRAQPFGLHAVLPHSSGLVLDVARSWTDRMDVVARLSPVLSDGGIAGVSGLRTMFYPDRTVIHPVDGGARIVLRKLTRDDWTRALRENYGTGGDDMHFLHEELGDPHPEELRFGRARRSPAPTPTDELRDSMLSGLLRRAHIFSCRGQMDFVDTWWHPSRSTAAIQVEWAGDLTHALVVDRLLHPVFGLPFTLVDREDCLCDPCLRMGYSVEMMDTISGCVGLSLRRNKTVDEITRGRTRPVCSGDADISRRRRQRWSRLA